MPLYGYQEMLDNRVATLVVAADTVEEFVQWKEKVVLQPEAERNFNEVYTSTFLDHMTQASYKGFKHAVYAFYHNDEAQREAFVAEHGIQEVKSEPARDRHLDMLHRTKVAHEEATQTEEEKNMTIEERFGLDKEDPWDRRSDEEKEEDQKMKDEMKKMREAGELSGDSFGGADGIRQARGAQRVKEAISNKMSRSQAMSSLEDLLGDDDLSDYEGVPLDEIAEKLEEYGIEDIELMEDADYDAMVEAAGAVAKGIVNVTGIDTERNSDGSIDINNVTAIKHGGEVDSDAVEAREAAEAEAASKPKKVFSPDDFAAVLRGDGSADHINIAGDDRQRRGEGISRPSLSEHAEAERKAFADAAAEKAAEATKAAAEAADAQALKDREAGVFRGADLVGEEQTDWDNLPERLREQLEKVDLKKDAYPTKNYPYSSELGGKILLPSCSVPTSQRIQVLGGVNVVEEGAITMGDQSVVVMSKKYKDEEAWAVYGRTRTVSRTNPNDPDDTESSVVNDVWLVKIR